MDLTLRIKILMLNRPVSPVMFILPIEEMTLLKMITVIGIHKLTLNIVGKKSATLLLQLLTEANLATKLSTLKSVFMPARA